MDAETLASRFARLRLISLDCDGVMTDGGLYYDEDGREMRRFSVRDGVGIKALMAAGIEVVFLTSSRTAAIGHRAKALGVTHCLLGVDDKLRALTSFCAHRGIPLEAVAHVGDDVNDIPLLQAVGVPMTVSDSVPTVRALARYVSGRPGGDGAVREIAEAILAARTGTSVSGDNGEIALSGSQDPQCANVKGQIDAGSR